MHPTLQTECAKAVQLLREYADITDGGEQWRLFVRIEQIWNMLALNQEMGASQDIRDAYNELTRFVTLRVRYAEDAASPFSLINYYGANDPRRVRALAERRAQAETIDRLYPTRFEIFDALAAKLGVSHHGLTAGEVAGAVQLTDAVAA